MNPLTDDGKDTTDVSDVVDAVKESPDRVLKHVRPDLADLWLKSTERVRAMVAVMDFITRTDAERRVDEEKRVAAERGDKP